MIMRALLHFDDDPKRAQRDIQRAIDLDPDETVGYYYRAIMAPLDANPDAIRADILNRLKRPDEAEEALRRALDLNPGDDIAQKYPCAFQEKAQAQSPPKRR